MLKSTSEFVMELLDKECFQIDVANKRGETPLILAAAAGKVDVMQKLIARGKLKYTFFFFDMM